MPIKTGEYITHNNPNSNTMKTSVFSRAILPILAVISSGAIFLTGCNNDNEPQSDGNHRLDKDINRTYSYTLSLGGDYIEESEEPLTRAYGGTSYVGINVRRTKTGTSISENYAYGVFTVKNNIQIDLAGGYTYDFEATVLTGGSDELKIMSSIEYQQPFRLQVDSYYNTWITYEVANTNKFIYNHNNPETTKLCSLGDLRYGQALVAPNNNSSAFNLYRYPRVERYYGVTRGFNPDNSYSGTNSNIEIQLAYRSFGIKVDASELPSGASLTWTDVTSGRDNSGNDIKLLRFPDNIMLNTDAFGSPTWEDVYSLYNLTGDDTESFTFQFTLTQGAATETFNQTFQVRAKYKKVLKITVDQNSSSSSRGNIIINEQSNDLVEDELTIVR